VQIHQPRLAEMVADVLRDRIVTGRLKDGDELPRQEDLLAEFNVSRPSLREALRILEAEGLITVRRGNLGGAVVHSPQVGNAAYSVGLVLQSRGVPMTDLRDAIKSIEPVCAGLCAARDDRHEEVLPSLRQVHERVVAAVDDDVEFTISSRRFHEQLVAVCGNQTLILVVGALESLWSSREEAWARDASQTGSFPDSKRRQSGVRAHERILKSIEDGDVDRVQRQARVHLESSLLYAVAADVEKAVEASSPRQSWNVSA
jgi:GntR family transcriptional regulator, transcriptional repressor for pyruvate dehydrogenase complex